MADSDEPDDPNDYTNFRLMPPPRRVVSPLPLPSDAPVLWQTLFNVVALCGEIEKVSQLDNGTERNARLLVIALAAKGLKLELGDLMTVRLSDHSEGLGEDEC